MRLTLASLLVFCLPILASAQAKGGSLYFLADGAGRWCGFATERLWAAEKDSMAAAPLVAKVDYANGRVASVYLTEVDETGDWTTYDRYSFDKNEMLTSLERTIDLADGLKEEQSWAIRNGEAVKQKSTRRNSATNAIVPEENISFPSPTVIAEAQAFPFWSLIRDRRPNILSSGKICMPDNPPR